MAEVNHLTNTRESARNGIAVFVVVLASLLMPSLVTSAAASESPPPPISDAVNSVAEGDMLEAESGERIINTEGKPMEFHGGYVQHHPHVYAIFWGSDWNSNSAAREDVLNLYKALPGSSYGAILTQYFDYSGPISNDTALTSFTDTRVSHPGETTEEIVKEEVHYAINHDSGWKAAWEASNRYENQYVVFTPPATTNHATEGCGFHGWNAKTWQISFTYIPWPRPICERELSAGKTLQVIASHEWAESATDPIPYNAYAENANPLLSGWAYGDTGEIGDLCQTLSAAEHKEISPGVFAQTEFDDFLFAANSTPCVAGDSSPQRLAVGMGPVSVSPHKAILWGQLSPAGWLAGYRFELTGPGGTTFLPNRAGKESIYTGFPSSLETAGEGANLFANLGPSALAEGLKGNTTYTVRFAALSRLTLYAYVTAGTAPSSMLSGSTQFTTPSWPPIVSTTAPTGVIHQEATLNGSVNPQGEATSYHFEYGPTTSYGTKVPTPDGSAGSGESTVPVSQKLTGLEDGTYHYRIVASNGEGTSYGSDQTFLIDNRPLIKGVAASNVKSGSATLGGEIEPQNFTSTYHVEYVRDSEFKEDGFARAKKLPVPDASAGSGFEYHAVSQETGVALEPETLYHYRLVATNVKGTRSGEEQTFKTGLVAAVKDSSWGKAGSGHGEFSETADLALDGSGNVLAGDSGTVDRIQKFDPNGSYLAEFGKHGSGNGEFSGVAGLALTSTGDIWVADCFNNRLEKFNSAGQFVTKFGSLGSGNNEFNHPAGVAVDLSNGNIWVADYQNSRVQEFNSAHEYLRTIKGGSGNGPALVGPEEVALDKSGNIWVSDYAAGRVTGYTPTGTFIVQVGSKGSGSGQLTEPRGVAFSPSGDLLVTDTPSGTNDARMQAFSTTGEYLGLMATGLSQGPFTTGLAVSKNLVYVAESGGGIERVSKYHIPQAKATSAAGQSVKAKRATLAGTVEPNGSATTYRFEYGTTKAYGTNAPTPDKALGSETSSQELQQAVAGLMPHTVYHYRLVAFNASGVSYGEDKTFETASISAPVATTEAASAIKPSRATLNATVNPNEADTNYWFEYGKTTSYGTNIPAPFAEDIGEGYEAVKVSQTPSLEPNTTYHFRVKAINEGGTTSGEDRTFTTPRAFSAPTYSFSFGSSGSGNGQFSSPWGIAADPSGNVWVADSGNNRVEKFNSKGEYQCKIGSLGSGNGQFNTPRGVAADANGNVWVVDGANNRLEKVGSSCEYLSQLGGKGSGNGQLQNPFGVAIDPAGNIWVSDRGNVRIEKFNSKGEYLTQCGSLGSGNGQFEETPQGIATDADGNVWVGDTVHGAQEFNSKCEFVAQLNQSGSPDWVNPWAIAVDPSGNLWMANLSYPRIYGFYPEGEYVTSFGESGSGNGQFKSSPYGIAAASDGSLWVVDRGNNRVQKWTRPALSVETGSASQIKRTEATLNAKVNPEGVPTNYQFEYGTSTSLGSVIPASPKSIGSGTSAVAVNEVLSGLKAGTTYYYHVVATGEKGTTYGEMRHFTTLPGAGAGAVMRIGGKTFTELGVSEASFALGGSFKIEFSASGNLVTFNCAESGSGTLASGGVKQESVTLSCTLAGAPKCTVEPITFKVDGSFHPEGTTLFTIVSKGEECWLSGGQVPVAGSSGSFEYGSEATSMNVNSRATAKFGGWNVTLTGNSKWSLTGSNVGKVLGFW